MDIMTVINQMMVLLLLLVIGVVARKTGITDNSANAMLSKIVLNLSQSAMILASVMNVEPALSGTELLFLVGVAFITYVILGALAFVSPMAVRADRRDWGVYRFMTMFGNVGFMGFPVVASLFGPEAVFYASLFNIPFNVLTYSIGIVFIAGGEEKSKFDWKQILNTPMFATVIALIIFVLKIPIPDVVASATRTVGDTVVPLAMLIIGGSLGGISLKTIFGQWRIYAFMPVRLIVSPVVVWAILRLFVANETILGIATVLAAMPVAAITTMLAIQYKGNEQLASCGVFLTTVISVVTIPLVVYLLLV